MASKIVFDENSDKMDHDLEIFEKQIVSILCGSSLTETKELGQRVQ